MPSPQAAPAEATYPANRWPALFILLLASFMNLIDVTIVNVALPRMQASMGATSSQIEWVVAAYVLAFALGLLPFGRLGDTVGRARMFLIGVTAFTAMSALCGLAPDMNTLIAARVLQGLAGALMTPQVLAIVAVIFPPAERGGAFALFGLAAGLASVAGPLAGGLLIEGDLFGLDWRPIFLVNVPVGLLTVLAGWFVLPRMPGNPSLKHDPVGVLIAGAAVFLLIFPLIEGRGFGWPWWAFAMVAAAFVMLATFFLYERYRDSVSQSQLLPVSLMSNGNFLLGSLMSMTFFSGVAGFFLVLAVFLQGGFGFTPLQSGLTTIPFPIGILFASVLSGRLRQRWQKPRIAIGSVILIAGMAYLSYVVSGIGDAVDHWDLVAPLVICGFGMGTAISPLFQTVLSAVPGRDAGAGSGALQSFQQIGSALGIAITGEIFFSALTDSFMSGSMPHPAFVAALGRALTYELIAFTLVILLVLMLKTPTQQFGHEGPPVPVEA
ncbi:MAG: MFS transporter [Rhizobiaceae bacterium]|nr:MFS transporter [Rhizobiaceae bacterium]